MDNLLLILTLGAYYPATLVWLGYVLMQKEVWHTYASWLMAGGLVLHTLALIQVSLEKGFFPVATLGGTLLIFSWTLVAAFLFINRRHPIRVLGSLVAPLAALILSSALILPRQVPLAPLLHNYWLTFHIGSALLGTATFTLAFLGGILYLLQEHQIKTKQFGFFYRRLPSLELLDALNYYCLKAGFLLLTFGIVSGSLYAQFTLGTFWRWDPKETLTLIAWLLYAVLLHERLAMGWRGRRAALMVIVGFVVLLVTFFSANLWLQGYHSFDSFRQHP